MTSKKINDLTPATTPLSDAMQLETDIGGVTANKITLLQLKDYVHIGVAIESVTGDIVDNTDPANPIVNQTAITALALDQTGLSIKGASANKLTIKPNETLSSARTLNVIVNDADKTINLGGNITTGGAATLSGAYGFTGTLTNTTAVTFPTSGTLTTLATVVSTANTYTKAQRGAFSALTDSGTIALDFSLANYFRVTLGGNRTLDVPTNLVEGQSGVINVRQDGTGSRTLAYAWPYVFPGSVAPVLSTAKYSFDSLAYLVNHYLTSAVTMTIAAPCVVTWTAHGMASGYRIQLTTTGALPTGLSAATTYWVNVIDANTFNLSTTLANLQAGTYITTTGSQSGVHTAISASITIGANLLIG